MSFKTPQEKKRLSLSKDRRNSYGENDKASRRLIPLRKRQKCRKDRRVSRECAAASIKESDLLDDNSGENRAAVHVADKKRTRWRKEPDRPLGEAIRRKHALREMNGMGEVPKQPSA